MRFHVCFRRGQEFVQWNGVDFRNPRKRFAAGSAPHCPSAACSVFSDDRVMRERRTDSFARVLKLPWKTGSTAELHGSIPDNFRSRFGGPADTKAVPAQKICSVAARAEASLRLNMRNHQ